MEDKTLDCYCDHASDGNNTPQAIPNVTIIASCLRRWSQTGSHSPIVVDALTPSDSIRRPRLRLWLCSMVNSLALAKVEGSR